MANSVKDTGPHLGGMISAVTEDLSSLIKDQVALTKAELRTSAQTVAKSTALLAAAAFIGVLAVIFILLTLAWVLAIWLPVSAAFGIVAGLLLLLAVIIGAVGQRRLKTVQPPNRSIVQAQETKQLLSHPGAG